MDVTANTTLQICPAGSKSTTEPQRFNRQGHENNTSVRAHVDQRVGDIDFVMHDASAMTERPGHTSALMTAQGACVQVCQKVARVSHLRTQGLLYTSYVSCIPSSVECLP